MEIMNPSKKLLAAVLFGLFVVSSNPVWAMPDLFAQATLRTPGTERDLTLPLVAEENAPVIFLGTGIDPVSGRTVEGYAIIDYRQGRTHKEGHTKGGKKNGEKQQQCFQFLAKGTKWKTTEQYVLDTTNRDGLLDAFVKDVFATSFETWDTEVAVDIFGSRDTIATVDGADTQSPDGKNEVMFGDISTPGAIAVTIVWGVFRGPPFVREIVEYDMVYDDGDFDFGNANISGDSVMDLQNIATHEIGHAAGMGHPDDSCSEETMFRFADFGEIKKRTLNIGDIAGITKLYE